MFTQAKVGMRAAAAVIGVLALGAAATQASASGMGSDVVVRYADLNLNTRTGAETLYGRIEQAAAQICPQVDPVELQRHRAAVSCQAQVVAHAVANVRSPQLAAVYESRSHHTPV